VDDDLVGRRDVGLGDVTVDLVRVVVDVVVEVGLVDRVGPAFRRDPHAATLGRTRVEVQRAGVLGREVRELRVGDVVTFGRSRDFQVVGRRVERRQLRVRRVLAHHAAALGLREVVDVLEERAGLVAPGGDLVSSLRGYHALGDVGPRIEAVELEDDLAVAVGVLDGNVDDVVHVALVTDLDHDGRLILGALEVDRDLGDVATFFAADVAEARGVSLRELVDRVLAGGHRDAGLDVCHSDSVVTRGRVRLRVRVAEVDLADVVDRADFFVDASVDQEVGVTAVGVPGDVEVDALVVVELGPVLVERRREVQVDDPDVPDSARRLVGDVLGPAVRRVEDQTVDGTGFEVARVEGDRLAVLASRPLEDRLVVAHALPEERRVVVPGSDRDRRTLVDPSRRVLRVEVGAGRVYRGCREFDAEVAGRVLAVRRVRTVDLGDVDLHLVGRVKRVPAAVRALRGVDLEFRLRTVVRVRDVGVVQRDTCSAVRTILREIVFTGLLHPDLEVLGVKR